MGDQATKVAMRPTLIVWTHLMAVTERAFLSGSLEESTSHPAREKNNPKQCKQGK